MIAAITLLPALLAIGGCAGNSPLDGIGRAPLARDIGLPPPYLQPVANPEARAGQNAAVLAAERGAAVDKANGIIACTDAEWRATRMTLLAGERPVDAVEQGTCPALENKAAKAKPDPPKGRTRMRVQKRGS